MFKKDSPSPATKSPEYRQVEKNTPGAVAKRLLLSTISFMVRKAYRVHLSPESRQNLKDLNELLKDQSVIIYGHHPRMIDALILPLVLREGLPNLNIILEPLTIVHYHGLKKLGLTILGWLTDTLPLPVVRDQDKALFSEKKRAELMENLITTTDLYLSQPSNAYGVAPGGARTPTLEAKNTKSSFAKLIAERQLSATPMALIKTDRGNEVVVGPVLEPISPNTDPHQAAFYYMSQLARILPEELRGDYS